MFDSFLVCSNIASAILVREMQSFNTALFRVMRLVRAIRILRLASQFTIIRSIRSIVFAVVNLVSSFVPAMLMLAFVIYIFSLVFMQGVTAHLVVHKDDGPQAREEAEIMRDWYGSGSKSMWTLFGSVTGGIDWKESAAPLVRLGNFYVGMFILYIVFVNLGLLNVLTGLFVHAALQASDMNREFQIDSALQRRKHMVENIAKLLFEAEVRMLGNFKAKDINPTRLSWKSCRDCMQDEAVKSYFMLLDLDFASTKKIFEMLHQDERGEVDLAEFVHGCITMKGGAKMIDVIVLQKELKQVHHAVEELGKKLPMKIEEVAESESEYSPGLRSPSGNSCFSTQQS